MPPLPRQGPGIDRLTDRERFQVRAQVEGWRGNREAAIDILKARLAAYPDDRETWGAIGYNYMRLNRDRDALDAYAKQLAIDSGSVTDLINIATAHKGLGQYEESLRYYEKAFALQPSFRTLDNLNHEYGTTLAMAGKSKEARATFTLMLSGTPENQAMGHRSLGLLDELEGRFDDAIGHFRQAAVLMQARQRPLSEARNRLFLAMALRDKGRGDSARVELDAAYALFKKNYFEPPFLWYMGKALVANGQVARAKELLDSGAIGEPSLVRIHTTRAVQIAGQAMELDPDAMVWRRDRGRNPGGALYDDGVHKYATAVLWNDHTDLWPLLQDADDWDVVYRDDTWLVAVPR